MVTPLKILFATYWYLPHVGGVDSYINILKNELEENGHTIDVLAHHPNMKKIYMKTTDEEIDKTKIKDLVYDRVFKYYAKYMPHVDPWIRWRDIERYTFELAASCFDLSQYDIIHTQDIVSTRALWRVKPKQVPLVATIHGLLAHEHVLSGDVKSKDSLSWKYVSEEEYYGSMSSNVTIVPSRWLRKKLNKHFSVSKNHMKVIPYGTDISPFIEEMHKDPFPPIKIDPKKKIIACPARLVRLKGHRYLLKALKELKKKHKPFTCWIIGEGKYRKKLKKRVDRYDLKNQVKFLGNRYDIPALFNKADIIVLPSLQDNLPFTIMEAQIAGKPVVASNVGGIPEMIQHGETGLLFRRRKVSELKEQLSSLLQDNEMRKRLGENAKVWGRRQWSSEVLAQRTMDVYQNVTNKKGNRIEGGS